MYSPVYIVCNAEILFQIPNIQKNPKGASWGKGGLFWEVTGLGM